MDGCNNRMNVSVPIKTTCPVCDGVVKYGQTKHRPKTNGVLSNCGRVFHRRCILSTNDPHMRRTIEKQIEAQYVLLKHAISDFKAAYIASRYRSGRFKKSFITIPGSPMHTTMNTRSINTTYGLSAFLIHVMFFRDRRKDDVHLKQFKLAFLTLVRIFLTFEKMIQIVNKNEPRYVLNDDMLRYGVEYIRFELEGNFEKALEGSRTRPDYVFIKRVFRAYTSNVM